MSDTKNDTKVENMPAPELPKAPEVDANGIKVYPTSFLPGKSQIETSRIPTAKMSGLQIEVLHVIIFFVLTYALFVSMWKKPNVR